MLLLCFCAFLKKWCQDEGGLTLHHTPDMEEKVTSNSRKDATTIKLKYAPRIARTKVHSEAGLHAG